MCDTYVDYPATLACAACERRESDEAEWLHCIVCDKPLCVDCVECGSQCWCCCRPVCEACSVEIDEGKTCRKCISSLVEKLTTEPVYEPCAPLASQDTARWYAEAYRAGCGLAEAAAIENLAKGVN